MEKRQMMAGVMQQDDTTAAGAVPRPSATVLILRDDPMQVLMIERHPAMFLGGSMVFPGGGVEPQDRAAAWNAVLDCPGSLDNDERARRIAACRETYEETGLLLATDRLLAAPLSIEAPRPPGLYDLLCANGLRLDLSRLHPLARWITPAASPRRYDASFYVCVAPTGQQVVCDGSETVNAEWIEPAHALHGVFDPPRKMAFPTRMNLRRIAECAHSRDVIAAATARLPFITEAVRMTQEDGRIRITIPAAAGYGFTDEIE